MFDAFKTIAVAFSGKLKDHAVLRKSFWLFLALFAFGYGILFYVAIISQHQYANLLDDAFGIDKEAAGWTTTVLIASVIYFCMNSVAGALMAYWHGNEDYYLSQKALINVQFIVLVLAGSFDVYNNLEGRTIIAEIITEEVSGDNSSKIYDKIQAKIDEKERELEALLAGKKPGYGWIRKDGRFQPNDSGKKFQRALSKDIASLRDQQTQLSSHEAAKHTNDVTRYKSEVETKKTGHLWMVLIAYPLAFLCCCHNASYSDKVLVISGNKTPTTEAKEDEIEVKASPEESVFNAVNSMKEEMMATLNEMKSIKSELSMFQQAQAKTKGGLNTPEPYRSHGIGFKNGPPEARLKPFSRGKDGVNVTVPERSKTPYTAAAKPKNTVQNRTVRTVQKSRSQKGKRRTNGYQITCQHCGTKAMKKSPQAKYCSDKCRKDAYNLKNEKKLTF